MYNHLTKFCHWLILLIPFFLSVSSCDLRQKGRESEGASGPKKCRIDSSYKLNIVLTPDMSQEYRYQQYVEWGKTKTVMALSRYQNALEWINLENGEMIRRIPVDSEGPKGIPDVKAFHYINEDSIFLFSDYQLALVNNRSEIQWMNKINSEFSHLSGLNFHQKYLSGGVEQPIYFDQKEQCLYFGLYCVSHSQWEKQYYQGAISARLHLSDWSIDTLPVFFPEYYRTEFYGLLNQRNLTFLEDKIIYNFNNSSQIFIFDKKKNAVKVIDAPSRLAPSMAAPYLGAPKDAPALLEHVKANPLYLRVLYDPQHNCYYRLVLLPAKEKGAKKRIGLTVFDEHFTVISDELLPGFLSPYTVATPLGLMMYREQESTENKSTYLFFRPACS